MNTPPLERPVVYHIPVCPFSQRLEILLNLKGLTDVVDFQVVDITRPRPDWLLELTQGTTALPILQREDGKVLKESMILLRYLEDRFADPPVARRDPYEAAVERLLCSMEAPFGAAGYRLVMNQNRDRREGLYDRMLEQYQQLNAFLQRHNPDGVFLFETFGFSEAVFTPFFMRFWFLEYYEDFELPQTEEYARVRRWVDACLEYPAAQQVSKEQIVKEYYDYAKGAGNGALVPGRTRSSFVFQPHWSQRPWPPADKYGHSASDEELGLLLG